MNPDILSLLNEDEDTELPQEGSQDDAPIKLEKERLQDVQTRIRQELENSKSQRDTHVARAREYQRIYQMDDYSKSELLTAESRSIRTPLTSGRVDKALGSMTGALGIDPFIAVEVSPGNNGTGSVHVEAALNEEWRRSDGTSQVSLSIKNDLITSIGYLKMTAVQDDPDGDGDVDQSRIEITAPPMEHMWLSPHNVRDLRKCTLIAEAYLENMMDVKQYADQGWFDKDAVAELRGNNTRWEENEDVNAEFHGRERNSSYTDSGEVEILETYMRLRKEDDSGEEMWRIFYCATQNVVLRAEPWDDGFPYFPMRHDKVSNTIYSTPYPAKLKDLQYSMDMLFSASLEQDRLAISPVIGVAPNSLAWQWVEERLSNGEVGVSPGDVIPAKAGELTIHEFRMTPQELQTRYNQIEQYANVTTIPTLPMQTVRAATEIRFVVGELQAQEQQMLKAYRDDLTNALEYFKRLYWKYIAKVSTLDQQPPALDQMGEDGLPVGESGDSNDGLDQMTGEPLDELMKKRWVQHGSQSYRISQADFLSLRVVPRGMTTKSDQIMQQQGQTVMAKFILPTMLQKKAMEQAGVWPFVWEILRRTCESNDFQNYETLIGQNPTKDDNLVDLSKIDSQQAMQGMQLAQLNMGTGGGNPLESAGGMGNRPDGAQTSDPAFGGANGQGATMPGFGQ